MEGEDELELWTLTAQGRPGFCMHRGQPKAQPDHFGVCRTLFTQSRLRQGELILARMELCIGITSLDGLYKAPWAWWDEVNWCWYTKDL